MKPFRALLLSVLLVCASASADAAEPLPALQPEGVFDDEDPAANYLVPPPGKRARFRQMVNAAIQKNPRNSVALAHRAYLFIEGGDHARAKRDYDAALAAAEPGSMHEANVLWSRAWASYEQGDYAATFSDWQREIELHGGRPFWAAYSLALLYWTTGQSELALAWYSAAATADGTWRDADGVARKTRKWSPSQQERMQALFAAWSNAQVSK